MERMTKRRKEKKKGKEKIERKKEKVLGEGDGEEQGYSTILEVLTPGTFCTDLTGTEWCHETASSYRIHFPAHHSSCNGINSACNPCPNRKVLSGPISAYLKD